MSPWIAICYLLFFRKSRYERKPAQFVTVPSWKKNKQVYFFPRLHCNEFSNLIGSSRESGFSYLCPRNDNADVSFCAFVYKAISAQKLFSKELFIGQQNWRTKAFFSKQIFITILKWRISSLQRPLVYCICNVRRVCLGGSERIKKMIWESEEKKTNKLFAGLGSIRMVKKLWPRSWKCCPQPAASGSISRPR